jgi:hypothetical protein
MSEPLLRVALRQHRARELQAKDGIVRAGKPDRKYMKQAAELDWSDYDAVMKGEDIFRELKAL